MPSVASLYINFSIIYRLLQASKGCNWIILIIVQLPTSAGRNRTLSNLRQENNSFWDKNVVTFTKDMMYTVQERAKMCNYLIKQECWYCLNPWKKVNKTLGSFGDYMSGGKKYLKRGRQEIHDLSLSPAQHNQISNSNISSQFELYNLNIFTRVPYSLTLNMWY